MSDKRKWMIRIGLISIVFCAGSSFAVETPPLPQEIESAVAQLPVQHNGRAKPFESFARETLSLITGSETFGKASPVATVLHMIAFPEKWENEPILSIPYRPLRLELGLSSKQSHISYQGLFAASFMKRLPPIVAKEEASEKLTIRENEIMDLYNRFTTLHAIFSGDLRLIPSGGGKDVVWLPLTRLSELKKEDREKIQDAWQNFLTAYREGDKGKMLKTFEAFRRTVSTFRPAAMPENWRLTLEVFYHHAGPLHWAWVLYGISAILFAVSLSRFARMRWIGFFVFTGAALLHAGGIVMRMILAGRPPVSNFYESMLWLALVTVFLGFLFEFKSRVSYFGLSAAIFSGVTLLLAEHLPLDPAIQPIVAVLRSNKWLAIHVTTIVSSYGALTLATGIAHFYAGSILFRRENSLTLLGDALYRVIQIGVVLLAAGIMLGAVWANASWGRYWGWDPKETWALITLLWFLALLHARKAFWIGERGLAVGTLIGFFLLLMTYYGVSFYLVGLHSYAGGHAKPIPPLLIGYLIAECLFILSVIARISTQKNIYT